VGQHDLSYRLFFTHRRMIQDLLLKIVAEPWVEHLDLDSAELVNTSFVSAGRGGESQFGGGRNHVG